MRASFSQPRAITICLVSDLDQRARRQRRHCTGKPILRWWLHDGVLFCSTAPVWSREASDHVYQLAYVLSLLDRLHLRAGPREHSNLQVMVLPSAIRDHTTATLHFKVLRRQPR